MVLTFALALLLGTVAGAAAGEARGDAGGHALRYELGAGAGLGRDSGLRGPVTLGVTAGLGWAGKRLRLGIEGGLEGSVEGVPGHQVAWIGAAAGVLAAGEGERQLELVAGAGRRFYVPVAGESFATRRSVRGGAADLDHATARLVAWFGPRKGRLGVALWALHTFGTERKEFTIRDCGFLGCSDRPVTATFGGFTAGLSVLAAGQLSPAGPRAAYASGSPSK